MYTVIDAYRDPLGRTCGYIQDDETGKILWKMLSKRKEENKMKDTYTIKELLYMIENDEKVPETVVWKCTRYTYNENIHDYEENNNRTEYLFSAVFNYAGVKEALLEEVEAEFEKEEEKEYIPEITICHPDNPWDGNPYILNNIWDELEITKKDEVIIKKLNEVIRALNKIK